MNAFPKGFLWSVACRERLRSGAYTASAVSERKLPDCGKAARFQHHRQAKGNRLPCRISSFGMSVRTEPRVKLYRQDGRKTERNLVTREMSWLCGLLAAESIGNEVFIVIDIFFDETAGGVLPSYSFSSFIWIVRRTSLSISIWMVSGCITSCGRPTTTRET